MNTTTGIDHMNYNGYKLLELLTSYNDPHMMTQKNIDTILSLQTSASRIVDDYWNAVIRIAGKKKQGWNLYLGTQDNRSHFYKKFFSEK